MVTNNLQLARRAGYNHTRIFVVKVASRCNLACTYCYMYNHADQTWKAQPRFMARSTVTEVAYRLQEHAAFLNDEKLMVVVHGGEPLLYPDLDFFFGEIQHIAPTVEFAIQTNGTLLYGTKLAILEKYGVRVGVSVDGNREAHNRVRVTFRGEGTYDEVVEGIRRMKAQAPWLIDSVLQVIDPAVPPGDMLRILQSFGLKKSDLLFPDWNHDTLPQSGIRQGDIGRWLCVVFDEWVKYKDAIHIRIFITIIELLLKIGHGTDVLGATSSGVLMIETDGSYQVHDGLKTAFQGAGVTGLHVRDTAIHIIENLPLAKAFRDKGSAASAQCLSCRLFPVCGGGSPIHRYSIEKGFDQPSVYCNDLVILISHIRDYLLKLMPGLELAY